jgi:uncharacterized protein YjiS (DUF1127 family)
MFRRDVPSAFPKEEQMTMHAIPVTQPSPRADFLSHPLRALSVAFGTWQQQRRRRADLALLMSMEPHMLQDIGISLADRNAASSMLQWHPAVLASTLQGAHDAAEGER